MRADLAEEMALHREMSEGGGASRRFGSAALAADESHDVWVSPWIQDIWQDVHFASRMLRKDPRFAATVVLALGLAIAVNNTTFTILNTVNFRDLPFEEPNRLVSIRATDPRGRELGVSYPDFTDWRTALRTLSGIAAHSGEAMNISDDVGAPERVAGAYVSANTFPLLRVNPVLGRDFMAEDDQAGSAPVVILAYGLWQQRYGGDREILGRTIRVNDIPSTVVGVMPQEFRFPFSNELWQPLSLSLRGGEPRRDARSLNVFGRLRDSHTIEEARAELDVIAARMAAEHPESNKGIATTIGSMNERMRFTGALLLTLMAPGAFVLLIACANVANLLLGRAASRSREIAIRASLGATRWRIIRQLLAECGILAALAGVVGLALSIYGIRFLGAGLDGRPMDAPAAAAVTPYWVDLSMNTTVLLVLGAMCVCTTLLSGLAPALHISKANTNEALKESARTATAGTRARRWTSAFVVAQIALTLILVTGAGLMLRKFVTLYLGDRSIATAGLTTARLSLPPQKYNTPDSRKRLLERLQSRLSTTPLDVAITSSIPYIRVHTTSPIAIEGEPEPSKEEAPTVPLIYADERYFDVLDIDMIRGRSFVAADARVGHEGVVVNERFATMLFQDRDAVGQRIRLFDERVAGGQEPWRTIVGVARAIPQGVGSAEPAPPAIFVPLLGETTPAVVSLIARSRSDVAATVSQLRNEVSTLDPNLPLYYVQTLEEVFADARGPLVLIGGWLGGLALIALVLATVGLYALARHAVTQRTQEIGVRIALGAAPRQVIWLFLRSTLGQLVVGIALGMTGALAIGQLLQTWITGTNPRDPLTLVIVTILLTAAGIVATLVPAYRATRVSPLVALRYE